MYFLNLIVEETNLKKVPVPPQINPDLSEILRLRIAIANKIYTMNASWKARKKYAGLLAGH